MTAPDPAARGAQRRSVATLLGLSCLLVALFWSAPASLGQRGGQTTRAVQGKVLAPSGTPQASAVVYLENEKTQTIKSYITQSDGFYRFVQLSSDTDYQIWAKYDGMKSKSRTISSFESRQEFNFDLKLRPEKSSQ